MEVSEFNTEAEYWLLNLVVRYPSALSDLRMPVREFEDFTNEPASWFREVDLKSALAHLFENGDLRAYRPRKKAFVPTEAQIEDGLGGKQDIIFSLTAQGGRRWELESAVDWSLFIHVQQGWPDPNDNDITESTIIAQERALVEEWIAYETYPISELEWSHLKPWQPLYWKELPEGHQVTFRQRASVEVRKAVLADTKELWRKQDAQMELCIRLDKWRSRPWDDLY